MVKSKVTMEDRNSAAGPKTNNFSREADKTSDAQGAQAAQEQSVLNIRVWSQDKPFFM